MKIKIRPTKHNPKYQRNYYKINRTFEIANYQYSLNK